jgi:hypothetical protein
VDFIPEQRLPALLDLSAAVGVDPTHGAAVGREGPPPPREASMRQGPSPYLVVVPRGERAIYKALEARVGRQGMVEVIWDRRQGDRRRSDRRQRTSDSEQRRLGDRRRPPEDTRALGFVVASRHVGLLEPTRTIEKAEPLTFDRAKILANE